MLLFGICRLTFINPALGIIIEDTDIQKSCILTTAKHIFKHVLFILNAWIVIKLFHLLRNLNMIIRSGMESFV